MVKEERFAAWNGQPVCLLTIWNENMSVELLDYGATIRAIWVPDREGKQTDICLGYDSLEEYQKQDGYLGAIVGRNANRIANARFTLNGIEYCLTPNEGVNQLHGGCNGFDKKIWAYTIGEDSVTFALDSADGEEGFPGNLHVEVTYKLSHDTLDINYYAVSDKDTVVNLTNHAYFNLAGQDGGVVDDHILTVHAGCYTPVDRALIPTGEISGVEGSALDLRKGAKLGERFPEPALAATNGYDHNFVLDADETAAAKLWCPRTGIALEVATSMEGIQLYTAGALTERNGKRGAVYGRHNAVCLETQHFPDAVNHTNFPSSVLRAGEKYCERTSYRFFAE